MIVSRRIEDLLWQSYIFIMVQWGVQNQPMR